MKYLKYLFAILILFIFPGNVLAADIMLYDGEFPYTGIMITSAWVNTTVSGVTSYAHIGLNYDSQYKQWVVENIDGGATVEVVDVVNHDEGCVMVTVPITSMTRMSSDDIGLRDGARLVLNPSVTSTKVGGDPGLVITKSLLYYTVHYSGTKNTGQVNFTQSSSQRPIFVPDADFSFWLTATYEINYKVTVSNTVPSYLATFRFDTTMLASQVSWYTEISPHQNFVNEAWNENNTQLNTLNNTQKQIQNALGIINSNLDAEFLSTRNHMQSIHNQTYNYMKLWESAQQKNFDMLNNSILAFYERNNQDLVQLETTYISYMNSLFERLDAEPTYPPDGVGGSDDLKDAFGDMQSKEDESVDQANKWLDAYDPTSLFDLTGDVVVAAGQFNSFFMAILNAMGPFQVVIWIGIALIFMAIIVGVLRFRG